MAKPNVYELPDLVDHRPRISPEAVKSTFNTFNRNNFTILHVNIRSIINKMHLLELLLAQLDTKFSCIVISETWLTNDEFFGKYYLDGYNFFYSSRPGGGGGGVCVYVLDSYEASGADVRLAGSEAMVVRIDCSGRSVCTVLAVYRTPSGVPSAFLADWEACLPSLPSNSVIVGDLNFDLNPENDTDNPTLDYMRIMSVNGFYNIIETATRFGNSKTSLLDHIFVKNLAMDIRSCTVDTDILADHLPVIGSIAIPNFKHSHHAGHISITKLDREQLYEKINDTENWQSVLTSHDPDEAFDNFTTTMQTLINESSCTVSKKQNKKLNFKKPWMTRKIFRLITQRENCRKKIFDDPFNGKLLKHYTKLKNLAAEAVKKAKVDYFKHKFEVVKSNPNEKWTLINRILNRNVAKSSVPSCLETDTCKFSLPKEISECFNEFFCNIGTGLAGKLPKTNVDPLSYLIKNTHIEQFDFLEISPEITAEVIGNSSAQKAVGYDGISMAIIKDNKTILAEVLTHMINTIIRTSKFPDSQKIARVRPLHKKGDKSDRNNYRPISILTAISKITEKVLAIQLRYFLENCDILSDCQFGFREKRNTTSAISRLMEQLYQSFNDSKITQGIFLDFSKAFDTIDHSILIKKLPFYNFSSDACNLLESYLSNRKQFVKIDDFKSSLKEVRIGVPQGSVLGPILFLIYINDLINAAPMFNYLLFADDTNIFSNDPLLLKANLKKIEQWCLSNKLILNYT